MSSRRSRRREGKGTIAVPPELPMDAVLDTNVIVSAVISPKGPPAEIIRAWRAHAFTWITSDTLLSELEEVLCRPKISSYTGWSVEETRDFIGAMSGIARVVAPAIELNVVKKDPADNRVLEAAVEAKAEYIVTGDRDLLEIGRYGEISIVTPARFVAIIATGLT